MIDMMLLNIDNMLKMAMVDRTMVICAMAIMVPRVIICVMDIIDRKMNI